MTSAVATPGPTAVGAESPYKGLMPYAEEDADFYFGRDVWRDIVSDNLRAYRLTLFYGESGVGKTSLLNAGVIHRLREQGRENRSEAGTPGLAVASFSSWRGDPAKELTECIDLAVADALGTQPTSLGSDLRSTLEAASRHVGGKLFVVLDQFEEYFLYHPPDERDTFGAIFPELVTRRDLRASFLVAIREDAVAKLDRFKGQIPNLFDNYLRLDHLDRKGAVDAITCPVERFNALRPGEEPIELEPALVEAVLHDVEAGRLDVSQPAGGNAGAASDGEAPVETPYLQLVMTRLWDEETKAGSNVIRHATLQRLGGAEGIVETHLDAAMSALTPEEQDVAAKMFRYLVTRSRSKVAHRVSDLADWVELPEPALEPIITKLLGGRARILRPVGERSVEIYHDVLAEAVLSWRTRHEAREKLEKERREAEARTRRRLVRAGVGANLLALALAVAFAVLAWSASNDAKKQERVALSRAIAANALAQLPDIDPELGLLLAIEATRKRPTVQATDALRQAFLASKIDALLEGHDRPVTSAAFSRAGNVVISADGSNTRLWKVEDEAALSTLRDARGRVTAAASSSDGRRVVTAMKGGGARIWDARTGEPVRDLQPETSRPIPEGFRLLDVFAAFSPDDTHVLALGTDGAAHIWRTASGKEIAVLRTRVGVFNNASFSPDGTLVATAADDRTARLWDTSTGQLVSTLKGHRSEVWWTSFSADGRRLLTTGLDGTARVWDLSKRRAVVVLRPGAGRGTLSPDGSHAVTFGEGVPGRLWDVSTGAQKALLASSESRASITSAAFSPTGTRIATGDTSGAVRLWDGITGLAVSDLGRHEEAVRSVAFSANGRRVVTAGADRDVRVWRIASETTAELIDLQNDAVSRAAFTRDTRLAVTVAENGVIRVLNRGTGELLAEFRGRDERIVRAFYGPGGTDIFTVSATGDVAAWPVGSAEPRLVLRGGLEPLALTALSPDRERIVTLDGMGVVRVWDTLHGRRVARFETGPVVGSIRALAIDDGRVVAVTDRGRAYGWREANGRRIAATRGRRIRRPNVVAVSQDGRRALAIRNRLASIWETTSGDSLSAVRLGQPSLNAAFSPDGRRFLTVDFAGISRIWGVATGTQLAGPEPDTFSFPVTEQEPPLAAWSDDARRFVTALAGTPFRIVDAQPNGISREPGALSKLLLGTRAYGFRSAEFSPDGTRVVTAFEDGSAREWSVDGVELVGRPMFGADHRFASAALSEDGKLLAAGSRDGTMHIRDLASGRRLRVMRGHGGPVGGIAFSPDRDLVATAGHDGDVRLWSTATGDEALPPIPHPRGAGFTSAAVSPDGRQVVAGAEDGSAIVWDHGSNRVRPFRHSDGRGAITSVVFSRDGKWIATASADRTARVWDAGRLQEISIARGHDGPVTSATFNHDGTLLVTGGEDGTARVWEAQSGRSAQVLGRTDDVAAVRVAAFTPAGGVVTVDADGVTRRFVCAVCRSVAELLEEARSRIKRVLTKKERETYLYEGRSNEDELPEAARSRINRALAKKEREKHSNEGRSYE